eukprot:CAMPEP_0118931524 /NCGR_PEP_ID=MMETSP1169-20130426/7834_1 /TAXON_ID=36882 /ORGANISM="Pyramimonas obovata, Strain CCMP722" /LENGTH=123 /DNA_ID=CAMNT_0006874035 /DNA_START=64 /DNA_END=432 /DNA_ORIENTATION=+
MDTADKAGASANEYEDINRFFASFQPSEDIRSKETTDGNLVSNADGSYTSALLKPLFHSSHASNLLVTRDGTLHIVWFNGDSEGGAGNAIVYSSLAAGATRWPEPIVVSQQDDRSAQNPVLFY